LHSIKRFIDGMLNHLIDAYDSKYIDAETLKKFEEKVTIVEKLLNGYITFLRNTDRQK